MKYRKLGKTGYEVSEISLGTWQLGGGWGRPFDESLADETLDRAIDSGVSFLDTADRYQGGASERAVGRAKKRHGDRIVVATKCGRGLDPHTADGYNEENITRFVDASLSNTGLGCLDLLQLHCPPTEVYYRPEVFGVLDALERAGKIRSYGVSVEKVEEALKAIEYPEVDTVQIIFNMFRQRPAELFFREAARRDVGVIVRVPLASGLLSGKYGSDTRFDEKDHRTFNRLGQRFDRGETFSGVDYETGLRAVEELKEIFPGRNSLAAYALRWILMFEEVSCVIPGASRPDQAEANAAASDMDPLTREQMTAVERIYGERIKPLVHQRW